MAGARIKTIPKMLPPKAPRSLWTEVLVAAPAVGSLLVISLAISHQRLGINGVTATVAVLIYASIMSIVFAGLGHHHHARFGAANVITTIRAAMVALVGGLTLPPGQLASLDGAGISAVMLLVLSILVLDGIDGYLARRKGTVSSFGARFDMEVDALLIFFLSIGAYLLHKAGAWVLLIGGMRYLYVAAQALFPMMRGELPPSLRRKLVCVIQGAALCVSISPLVQPASSAILCGVALAALAYSFAVDTLHLLERSDRG